MKVPSFIDSFEQRRNYPLLPVPRSRNFAFRLFFREFSSFPIPVDFPDPHLCLLSLHLLFHRNYLLSFPFFSPLTPPFRARAPAAGG